MTFNEAVEEWREFYLLAGTGAVTLLGLLFVAVSLRLNIFRQREVADVRDFAFQTLTDFLFVGLIALALLIPNQSRAGVGLPLALMGVAGTVGVLALALESRRLNQGVSGPYQMQWPYYLALAVLHLALAVVGVVLLLGRTGALYWLSGIVIGLIAMSVFNAWLLLSHAGGSGDSP